MARIPPHPPQLGVQGAFGAVNNMPNAEPRKRSLLVTFRPQLGKQPDWWDLKVLQWL
jgi:hypothetical protein